MKALPLAVVAGLLVLAGYATWSNAQSGAAAAQAIERGRALFRNKGCVTCHVNDRVSGQTGAFAIGPNLTAYRNDPAFLRQWLADPRAVRPATEMPDLGLTAGEIDDLVAFLSEPR
jgi:cytochrome c2